MFTDKEEGNLLITKYLSNVMVILPFLKNLLNPATGHDNFYRHFFEKSNKIV